MSESLQPIAQAQKAWQTAIKNGKEINLKIDLETYRKLLNIVSVGPFYYYIFDLQNSYIPYVSPSITEVLGYAPEQFTPEFFFQIIHPDDAPAFIHFGEKSIEFLNTLSVDKIFKYKIRIDFRLKKSNGDYIRIMQQVVTMQTTETGGVNKTLGIHTDITHIKFEGNPVLSFVGMEGEPSYLNVDISAAFLPTKELLTCREKEILYYIVHGRHSNEIADILFISRHTVNNHRRSILSKTGLTSTAELIVKAIKEGWV
ncbi:MAG: LuxR C-terminal-related transcriptional regulator [Paludibacter sp.]